MVDERTTGKLGVSSSDSVSAFRSLLEVELFGSGMEYGTQSPEAKEFAANVSEWILFLTLGQFTVVGKFLQGEPWTPGAVLALEVVKPPMTDRVGTSIRVTFKVRSATVEFFQTSSNLDLGDPEGTYTVQYSKSREGEDPRDEGGNVKPIAQAAATLLWRYGESDIKTRRSKLYQQAD